MGVYEDLIDWLLELSEVPFDLTSGIQQFLFKLPEFMGKTGTLFAQLFAIFSDLINLIEYGLGIFTLLIQNFHVGILLVEIFIIGISCMKSTEPITILTIFFEYNYLLIELLIKVLIGIYRLLGVIVYNVVRMIPFLGE